MTSTGTDVGAGSYAGPLARATHGILALGRISRQGNNLDRYAEV